MRTWGRRIRGAMGMGLVWAAAWFGAGILLARVPGFHSDLPFALLFAPLGCAAGSLALARRPDRRELPRASGNPVEAGRMAHEGRERLGRGD